MKKLLFSLLASLPLMAFAQTFTADKIVAVVGNSAILYSELFENQQQILEQRKQSGVSSQRDALHEALEDLLLQRLLYQQAVVDSLPSNDGQIERVANQRIDAMIKDAGSASALEKAYNLPIFNIKDHIKNKYKQASLAQAMMQNVNASASVTPNEVERFYKNMDKDKLPIVPEQYEYAQITMFPPSTEEAKMRTREQLLEMRKRIIDGTRFDLLARMYSIDGSARRGGEMDPTPKDGFVAPFSEAMVKLKEGQVSGVVETEFGFHLIELLKKEGELYTCRHILLRPSFSSEELLETDRLLDSVITRVKAGEISFEQAAMDYSDDTYSKSNGGVVSNLELLEMYGAYDPTLASTKFFKDQLLPADYRVLQTMKVGEVSNAFMAEDVRGNTYSKAVKLLDIIPSHKADIENDYTKIKEMALAEKQAKYFESWLKTKAELMYVRIVDEYKNFEFENKVWVK
ncbi:MAG: peptidylprolyl isomerase [Rikenellaceae bacterium]